MTTIAAPEHLDTIYGTFYPASKRRLDLTFDYEDAQIRAFLRIAQLLRPTRFLDIGANIGVYSVYLRPVDSLSVVQAFEPTEDSLALLRQNFDLQHDERLEAIGCALSDRSGTATFKVYGDLAGNNAIASTEAVTSNRQTATTCTVVTKRLDDLVAAGGERFVAKIDVEGHEIQVIEGAADYLRDNTGVLQIESFGTNVDPLVELMRSLGYQRLAWMQHDHLFSNVVEDGFDRALTDIVFDEVQHALVNLQRLRRMQRSAVRGARSVLDLVRYDRDPVIS